RMTRPEREHRTADGNMALDGAERRIDDASTPADGKGAVVRKADESTARRPQRAAQLPERCGEVVDILEDAGCDDGVEALVRKRKLLEPRLQQPLPRMGQPLARERDHLRRSVDARDAPAATVELDAQPSAAHSSVEHVARRLGEQTE